MNQNNNLAMLSLAARAGKVVSGGFMTEKAVQEGSAYLVIIAEDASANTKKKFINKCKYYNVPCVICETMDRLGHMIGKESRTSVAVTEQHFAEQLIKKLEVKKDLEV